MDRRSRTYWRIALVFGACLLLTGALGGIMIHADESLEGLLELHVEPGLALLVALLIGFLVGVMIEDSRILFPVIGLMCVGAAGLYVAVILAPTWVGSIVRTTGLENFATTRAFLYFGLSFAPAAGGALLGRLLAEWLPGGEFLAPPADSEGQEHWLDRRRDHCPTRSGEGRDPDLAAEANQRDL